MLPTTITCRPSRSSFLFPFCFIFMFTKNYTSIAIYEKNFSWYTYIPMMNFFCTHALKLFLFTSTRSIYKPYSCSKISFFRFSQHTPVVYTKVSLYILVAHTRKNFFSHIIYTHKNPSINISFTYIKKLFSFLCIHRHDICSQRFFLIFGVIMILVHFIFRTTFLNEKLYTVPEFQQTLLTTTK